MQPGFPMPSIRYQSPIFGISCLCDSSVLRLKHSFVLHIINVIDINNEAHNVRVYNLSYFCLNYIYIYRPQAMPYQYQQLNQALVAANGYDPAVYGTMQPAEISTNAWYKTVLNVG